MVVGPAAPASAAGTITVCALTAGGSGVYRYDGSGTSWTRIGDAAGHLYGGRFGLFATTSDGRTIMRYLGSPFSWQGIGGAGATWAVTGDAIYGLSPDFKGVYKWDGSGTSWTQVGGPASWLYGGGFGVFAPTPDRSAVYQYMGSSTWRFIGRANAQFAQDITYAVHDSGLLGLDGDHRLWIWGLQAGKWVQVTQVPPLTWLVGGGGVGAFGLDEHGSLILLSGPVTPAPPFPIGDANLDVAVTETGWYAASPQRDSVWKWDRAGWINVGNLATQQLVPCP